jgi:hypothetical protein
VHDGYFRGQFGEVKRFVHGGIPTPDHSDLLVVEHAAVARGTIGDTAPFKGCFARDIEALQRAPTGEDDDFAGIGAQASDHDKRPSVDMQCFHLGKRRLQAIGFDLIEHIGGQIDATNAGGEARVILDRFGVGDLTAKSHALNHQGLQLLAGSEEGR